MMSNLHTKEVLVRINAKITFNPTNPFVILLQLKGGRVCMYDSHWLSRKSKPEPCALEQVMLLTHPVSAIFILDAEVQTEAFPNRDTFFFKK